MIEDLEIGKRLGVKSQTFALSIAFRLIPNWSLSSFLFCCFCFLSTDVFFFGLGTSWTGHLNCPLVIEHSTRRCPLYLFLLLLAHELVLFYRFLVIFALSIEALTQLRRFIEPTTPSWNPIVILPDSTQYCLAQHHSGYISSSINCSIVNVWFQLSAERNDSTSSGQCCQMWLFHDSFWCVCSMTWIIYKTKYRYKLNIWYQNSGDTYEWKISKVCLRPV